MTGKGKKNIKKKRLVLIDANAIIHRAFHALPPLSSPEGEPTNAVYGFTAILLRIIRELKPGYIVGAFDTPKPTFRHAAYKEYKATRVKAPDELYAQIPRTKDVLSVFGIPVLEKDGFEADDVIGTVAAKVAKKSPDTEIVIVTGDMDTLQLVNDKTKVWTMRKGVSDTVLYDEKAVRERFGIGPESLIDYKGLRGDPSDNIPGVKGIGEKTASELLAKHKHLEELYRSLEKGTLPFSEAVKEKLRKGKEDAFFSRLLGTIKKDAPISFDPAKLSAKGFVKNQAVEKLFRELGFFSLLKRLEETEAGKKKNEKTGQQELFAGAGGLAAVSDFKKVLAKKIPQETALFFDVSAGRLFASFADGEIFSLSAADLSSEAGRQFLGTESKKYIFDAKQLYKALLQKKVYVNGIVDLMIAAYLLDPGRGEYTLGELFEKELGQNLPKSADEQIKAMFGLGKKIVQHLSDEGLSEVFETIELPLTPVLAEMEERGIHLDTQWLGKFSKTVGRELAELTRAIYKDAGTEFNIASPRQVAEVLFGKIGIGTKGIKKTGGGALSTKFSELSKLAGAHPVVEKILRHRELSKLQNTYVEPLQAYLAKDGRLHTTFNQVGTETGRLASEHPNLQNIPVKTEFGRNIRKAFVAERGWTLISFDYSQIELRIAADLADDQKMLEAFRQGIDIHSMTAAEVNNIPLDKVTPELRRKAKALNFGVLYGMGPRGFAESAGISVEEAEIFIDEYFRDFRGIAEFIEKTKEFARENGYVKTAFGRKRYLPGIVSQHPMIRSESERMAVNMSVQGTATGDIMKKAMIEVSRIVKSELVEKARVLLQIHDELLCEAKDEVTEKAIKIIRQAMESVWKGKVRLKVDVKKGKNWAEAE